MGDDFVIKDVIVSDIIEYPTSLGERCKILEMASLSTYSETEEALMYVLEESAKDAKRIEICMSSSHCGGFYKCFISGETPFFDKDPIKLSEFGGKYYATEGKHRVCMAKRLRVPVIKARVYQEASDWFYPLAEVKVGVDSMTYCFNHRITSKNRPIDGDCAILWVEGRPFSNTGFNFVQRLDRTKDTNGKEIQVLDGLRYSVNVTKEGWLRPVYMITSTVMIDEQILPKCKVWLLRADMEKIFSYPSSSLKDFETIYRVGLWREQHAL